MKDAKKANELAEKLCGLLPKMTDEQLLKTAKVFDGFPQYVVEKVVEQYPERHEEFSLPRLMLLLRCVSAENDVRVAPTYRYVSVLRRDAKDRHPAAAHRISAMSDGEFMLRTGWGWAHPIVDLPGDVKQRSDLALEKIRREVCEILAAECGLSQAAAEQYAPGCLGSKNDLENYLSALHEIVQGPQEAEIPEFAR